MVMIKKTQLFLLHFGGGNCYSFQFFKKDLENQFEFLPLELPGRGKRISEPLLFDKQAAIDDYFGQIKKLRNELPFILYGHSMGASLGHLITKRLEELNDPPQILIISGNSGPGTGMEKKRYLLSDSLFKEELRSLGGVPEEVLMDDDLYEFFSPIMRADFEILEKDQEIEETSVILNTPIYAIMGDEEETVDEIENWKSLTNGAFGFKVLAGNHFFIHNQAKNVAEIIIEKDDRALVY